MKTIFCAFVVAALAVSCTSGPKEKPAAAGGESVSNVSAPLPVEGKRSAPVAIDASLRESSARLTLRFERKGEGVSVDVSGIDGLVLQGEGAMLREAAVAAGETKTFELTYARGPGTRTNLVINVRGTFDGAPLARVVTFAIGEGPLTQTGTRVILNDGEAFKVMNAQ